MLKSLVNNARNSILMYHYKHQRSTSSATPPSSSANWRAPAGRFRRPQQQQNHRQQQQAKKFRIRMPRQWVFTQAQDADGQSQIIDLTGEGPQDFRLVSYNILAQDLLEDHLYLYRNVNPQLLSWPNRLQRLRREITSLAPDILCLQEMQFNHLKELVQLIRGGERKMEYLFKKRTGNRTDGCAIIYDKEKFKLLDEKVVEYHMPFVRTLDRENVALIAKFALRSNDSKRFVVATTHLLYNPRRHDVRMSQIEVLLGALTEFSKYKEYDLPVILTGDFNSEPDSPPYQLLTRVHSKHGDCNPKEQQPRARQPSVVTFKDQRRDEITPINSNTAERGTDAGGRGHVRTPVDCNRVEFRDLDFGPSTATTFQDRWITVDYILQSIASEKRRDVQVNSVYQLLPKDECNAVGFIPNHELGSDHYCLAINFTVI